MSEFTTTQVERLTGVNRKTLHYWDQSGFLSPTISKAAGTGSRRVYAFEDVVAARVARELRQKGITLPELRQVVQFLRSYQRVSNPLAETYLVTDGKDVYAKKGRTVMSTLRHPGQSCLSFVVVDLSGTVAELRRLAKS